MVTMESADKALKSFYLGAVTEALDQKVNPLLAQVKKTTADVWGKDVRKLVRYGVNGGIGAGTETGNLPEAKGNQYVQFVSTLKNLYGVIEISDKAIKASANNEGAFVNLLNDEMQGLIASSSFNFGRMLYGDGSGLIGEVNWVEGNKIGMESVKAFAEGMIVDFCAQDGTPIASAQGRKVVAVDRTNWLVTFDGPAFDSAIVNDMAYCYLQGSYGNEITGLRAIFSGDSIYGVDKENHAWMKPYVATEVGDIDDNAIQKAIDAIEENSGSKVNFIVCSAGVRRALVQYYKSNGIRLSDVDIEGGYKAISFNGIPVVADRFCPDSTMYLLNTDDFCLHQLCDWQWLEGEDGKILKQVPGKPVYTATLVKYAELMCSRPNGQGMLTGIIEA
ncbi:MAG: phage major capsid protein [Clostridia bacterium]|nr:phage major capsid protein [Clostridia bacterium]